MRSERQDPELALARPPEEVPTPLAIAAADFCRRAGRQPSADSVRLALARLPADDDDALRSFLEGEPPARPLGPEALVDLFRGLSAREAAEREESGYYVALAKAPRTRAEPAEVAERTAQSRAHREARRQKILAALAEARGDLGKAAARLDLSPAELEVQLRRLSLVRKAQALAHEAGPSVGPKIRPGGSRGPRVRPSAPVPPPLPKRGAGRPPRGRLVLGAPSLRDWRELQGSSGKTELLELLRSYKGNRRQLAGRLAQVFKLPAGKPPLDQLDALLARHSLTAEAEKLERDNFRFLFGQARGDLVAVAKRLKLSAGELREELQARGMWQEIERLRDRYRREVLGRPIPEQVRTLLQRPAYLRDLRALEPLERQVRAEAERVWPTAVAAGGDKARTLAERLGIEAADARSLVERFRLR